MDSSGENLTQIESEIREVVLAFLRSNGSDVSAIDVGEDLVKTGNLDSFDAVSIIAELESTFGRDADFSSEVGNDFTMSVAWLARAFSR